MAIPSLETREVWLDIDLSGVKAGIHKVDVSLGTGASETKTEIVLEVLPFEMAGSGRCGSAAGRATTTMR